MRIAFFLLLFANLLFFAYSQGYFGSAHEANPDANRLQQQIEPEKIRLLSEKQVAALPVVQKKTENGAKLIACLEWGSFAGAEIIKAEAALSALQASLKPTQIKSSTPEYWVYIPPQNNLKNAQKKNQELRALRVNESQILEEKGPWQFAISLGVFKTQEAATNQLAQLRKKGVRSAKTGERPSSKVSLQIREVPRPVAEKIVELKKDFSGSEVKECVEAENKNPLIEIKTKQL